MDKDFRDLLTRFVNGNCTNEEREKIHRWYEKIADNGLELGAEEQRLIGARMLANIKKESAERRRAQGRQRAMFPRVFGRVAAAVVVLVLSGLWFSDGESLLIGTPEEKVAVASTDIVFENMTEKTIFYRLPDGSTVRLDPSSSLRFPKDFSVGDRQVYLTGKAFFDIVKDSSRPFYVYSGKIATRVLGTSFFVDAPADAVKVAVEVISGKVSVFCIQPDRCSKDENFAMTRKPTTNGVVLSPNEKVEYFIEGGHWVTGLVEAPVPVKSIDNDTFSFVFENTTIRDVLEDINERYAIEVMAENEKVYKCTFTGDVSRMALYDMLDVISNAIGSTYEVRGTRILLSGRGCF